jgi:hypothetical protein
MARVITETEEGPMSAWEAIWKCRANAQLVGGLANGHHLYLDELRLKLPNGGTMLGHLARSYCEYLPTISVNLNALGKIIQSLEAKGPACVVQTKFNQAKAKI